MIFTFQISYDVIGRYLQLRLHLFMLLSFFSIVSQFDIGKQIYQMN